MRVFGIILLVVGFLWIAWDAAFGFTEAQYTAWIYQSQHLPPGEILTREQASAAMREFSLMLEDMHRAIFIPATLMLVGGLIAAFGQPRDRSTNRNF